MDPDLVRLMERGMAVKAVDFKRLEIIRTRQWHELCRAFGDFDALLYPTMALPAPPVGLDDSDFDGDDDEGRYQGLDMTCPFNNIAQCPALSVPSGFTTNGLPTGLQIVGHRFDDLTVLRIGAALEAESVWTDCRPPL